MNPIMNSAVKDAEVSGLYQQSRPITFESVINKTIMYFSIMAAVAAGVFFLLPVETASAILLPVAIAGIVLGLVIGFSKKPKTSTGLLYAYTGLQGALVGSASSVFNYLYEGVVTSALVATVFAAGAIFLGWKTGIIKVTDNMLKVFSFAVIGYLGFLLVELGFGIFTGGNLYTSEWGWLVALIGTALASYSLAVDFRLINDAVVSGASDDLSDKLAVGVVASLVWMYIEILRFFGAINRE